MTDKEFVLSVYPNSVALMDEELGELWMIVDAATDKGISDIRGSSILAWASAAKRILEKGAANG